jgi:N-acetylglucosaminyldiphosphoundecaprenol N-acetyl-beta-D-mannosaminyltransferase
MIDRGKRDILGVLVNVIDYEAAVAQIADAALVGRSLSVTALAVHGVMTGALDAEHRYRLNHLDLVVPDGQPVRWALNALHQAKLRDRVYGPTLTLKVCARAAELGLPVYFFGSTPEILRELRTRLVEKFPKLLIAGMTPSKFRRLNVAERDEMVEQIRKSGATITFVGLGCPRQEVWSYENAAALSMPVLAVGAAFAFHAGLLTQAPSYLQRMGLEWFYRLIKEPRRLWRRYVYLNPAYLWLLASQASGLHRIGTAGTPPSGESLYG